MEAWRGHVRNGGGGVECATSGQRACTAPCQPREPYNLTRHIALYGSAEHAASCMCPACCFLPIPILPEASMTAPYSLLITIVHAGGCFVVLPKTHLQTRYLHHLTALAKYLGSPSRLPRSTCIPFAMLCLWEPTLPHGLCCDKCLLPLLLLLSLQARGFLLPLLPYGYDALQPVISEQVCIQTPVF